MAAKRFSQPTPSAGVQCPSGSRERQALVHQLEALASCHYRGRTPAGHIFRGRRPFRSPIVFAPLVAALATLPWLITDSTTWLQASVSCLLWVLSAALLWMGWPHRLRVTLSDDLRRLHSGKLEAQSPAPPHIELCMASAPTAPQCQYQVCLVVPDTEERFILLKGRRPDLVLRELHQWVGSDPSPRAGWGLADNQQPWTFDTSPGAAQDPTTSTERLSIAALRTDPRLSRVVSGAALITIGLQLWLTLASRTPSTTFLSQGLPLAFIVYLAFVAGACRAHTLYQRSGSRFRLRTGFPPRYSRWQSVRQISDICVVGDADGAEVCHVLFSMHRGIPVAARVRVRDAARFQDEVLRDSNTALGGAARISAP